MTPVFYIQILIFLFAAPAYSLDKKAEPCAICLTHLDKEFSIDAWGNPYHSYHEQEGVFCSSCSRIISEGVTGGGFQFSDGRYLCSLCQSSLIEKENDIQSSFRSVRDQLNEVGFHNIPQTINITLVNGEELAGLSSKNGEKCLKGFTLVNTEKSTPFPYQLFLLFGLPKIEFEAVLAHELLHVWLLEHHIQLEKSRIEGFCNVGSALILENNNTKFAHIQLKAMHENPNPAYGNAFRSEFARVKQLGWIPYIENLMQVKQ
ncbi:MAG: protein DA1 [Candidatus Marinimicrobia bacterium]|nr:protein DA1 [Candidatus Neomarinimicrobiota bacterium]